MGMDIYLSAAFGIDIGEDHVAIREKLWELLEISEGEQANNWDISELLENFHMKTLGVTLPQPGAPSEEYREYYRLRTELSKKPYIQAIRYGSSEYDTLILGIKFLNLGECWEAHEFNPDDMHPTDDELRYLMKNYEILGITDAEPKLYIIGFVSY